MASHEGWLPFHGMTCMPWRSQMQATKAERKLPQKARVRSETKPRNIWTRYFSEVWRRDASDRQVHALHDCSACFGEGYVIAEEYGSSYTKMFTAMPSKN